MPFTASTGPVIRDEHHAVSLTCHCHAMPRIVAASTGSPEVVSCSVRAAPAPADELLARAWYRRRMLALLRDEGLGAGTEASGGLEEEDDEEEAAGSLAGAEGGRPSVVAGAGGRCSSSTVVLASGKARRGSGASV